MRGFDLIRLAFVLMVLLAPQLGRAQSSVNLPILRENWIDLKKSFPEPKCMKPSGVVIHHSHTPVTIPASCDPNQPSEACLQAMRAILTTHTDSRGWDDIGYNYTIDPNGLIYEGRDRVCKFNHGRLECQHLDGFEEVQAAHAGRKNNECSLGIALMGDLESQRPTDRMMQSLIRFITTKFEEHRINVNEATTWFEYQAYPPHDRIYQGSRHADPALFWDTPIQIHRHLKDTLCPGHHFLSYAEGGGPHNLYATVEWVRRRVARMMGEGFVTRNEILASFRDGNTAGPVAQTQPQPKSGRTPARVSFSSTTITIDNADPITFDSVSDRVLIWEEALDRYEIIVPGPFEKTDYLSVKSAPQSGVGGIIGERVNYVTIGFDEQNRQKIYIGLKEGQSFRDTGVRINGQGNYLNIDLFEAEYWEPDKPIEKIVRGDRIGLDFHDLDMLGRVESLGATKWNPSLVEYRIHGPFDGVEVAAGKLTAEELKNLTWKDRLNEIRYNLFNDNGTDYIKVIFDFKSADLIVPLKYSEDSVVWISPVAAQVDRVQSSETSREPAPTPRPVEELEDSAEDIPPAPTVTYDPNNAFVATVHFSSPEAIDDIDEAEFSRAGDKITFTLPGEFFNLDGVGSWVPAAVNHMTIKSVWVVYDPADILEDGSSAKAHVVVRVKGDASNYRVAAQQVSDGQFRVWIREIKNRVK